MKAREADLRFHPFFNIIDIVGIYRNNDHLLGPIRYY